MDLSKKYLVGLVVTCLFALASCGPSGSPADVASALAHPDRPQADRADDESRLPAETLAFAGLEEGMNVYELEAGGGYYTEILSRSVGPEGTVTMQNPAGLMSFFTDALESRTGNLRLPNVGTTVVDFDALDAEDNSMDMVTWIMGPHELGFAPGGNSLGDPAGSFQEIARILRPGGVFLAIDHIAEDGSGIEVGGTLHRIAEDLVTQLSEDAGLSLLRSSDILKNPDDPLDNNVFDPSIQGSTSKFMLLFEK